MKGSGGVAGAAPTPQARCTAANLRAATAGPPELSSQSSSAGPLQPNAEQQDGDSSTQTGITPFPPPAPVMPSASSSPAVSRVLSPTPTADTSDDGFSNVSASEGRLQGSTSLGVRSVSDESDSGMSWIDAVSDSDSASEAELVRHARRSVAAGTYA